jgi:hypothetical protein
MKWFSLFRGLVYLKRISESLDILARIESEKFVLQNPRFRGWKDIKARQTQKDDSKTVIEKASIEQINKWYREDNEIQIMAKEYKDREEF